MNIACPRAEKKDLVYESQKQIETKRRKTRKSKRETKGELMRNTYQKKKGKM